MRPTSALGTLTFVFLSIVAVSAQYAGWTIPPGGKDEKSPLTPTAAVLAAGKATFVANCQACHGPLGKGDGPDSDKDAPAADLTDEFRIDLNPDGVLFYKITNGKPPVMPVFGEKLTKDQIWPLVEHVKSLRAKP